MTKPKAQPKRSDSALLSDIQSSGRSDAYTALSFMAKGLVQYKRKGSGIELTALGLAAIAKPQKAAYA